MKLIENGDIFTDDADVLVCPVNCVGVMGKGLALEFKRRFHWLEKDYRSLQDVIHPGDFRIVGNQNWSDGREVWTWVGLAYTKDHWRDPSRLEWVTEIIDGVGSYVRHQNAEYVMPTSIAIPALGCGLGGLDWADVLPIMQRHFAGIDARVYPPRRDR